MFNLIVTGRLEQSKAKIPAVRTLEYTDAETEAEFFADGSIIAERVKSLPTIIMNEGTDDQEVAIGMVTQVMKQSGDYVLTFTRDTSIPRFTNGQIYEMAAELGIHDFEFFRNHWAIKEADLFQALLKGHLSRVPTPSVFSLSEKPTNPTLVTLMMPFSGAFSGVYESLKGAIEADGFECTRADDFWMHDHIIQDIVELICTSKVVICDLSGRNSNVFYEAGIAHTLGKNVI
jgi:hypothetical protein